MGHTIALLKVLLIVACEAAGNGRSSSKRFSGSVF